jgi:hypothetical protein
MNAYSALSCGLGCNRRVGDGGPLSPGSKRFTLAEAACGVWDASPPTCGALHQRSKQGRLHIPDWRPSRLGHLESPKREEWSKYKIRPSGRKRRPCTGA